MLITKSFNSQRELLTLLRGVLVFSGTTGTNAAGGATFTDATGLPFASAAIGDTLVISGETPTSFAVTNVTDDNNIVVTPVIATLHNGAAYATWRLFRGGIDPASIVVGPEHSPIQAGAGFIIYDATDFGA